MVVGPREREQAHWQEEAGGVLWCTRSLVPGARQNVNQTRKMGVLPAQKCSGDALRAYLSGRDVGWYGCTSSARSAIHPPPWSHPVAQPGAPDVYPSGARLRPHPIVYSNRIDTAVHGIFRRKKHRAHVNNTTIEVRCVRL